MEYAPEGVLSLILTYLVCFKSAVYDGILLDLLQQGSEIITGLLAGICNAWPKLSYDSKSWQKAPVVFILRTSKTKVYRPKILNFFLPKPMERIVDDLAKRHLPHGKPNYR